MQIESIWIEINLPHTKPILFCSVYRPPNSPTEWIDTFEIEVMKASSPHNPEILIAGDLNIDMYKVIPKKWKHLCDFYNLEQMIQKPTRVTSDSETLIDHIYTNRPEHISEIQVPIYAISDHYPICITRHAPTLEKKHNHLEIQYRDTSKFKDGEYLEDLKKEPFHLIDDINYCDNAVEMFYAFLNKVFNEHAPLKTKCVKQHTKPRWLSSDIKDAMHTRDRYHKQKDWENYKKWRSLVTEKIKKAKHEYYKQAILRKTKSLVIFGNI